MKIQVQVTKIGDALMLPLTKEIVQQIGVVEGENISLTVEDNKIVARPSVQAELETRVDKIVANLLIKRKSAYEKLAEGA